MSNNKLSNHGRRRFLKLAGSGLAITGGVGLLPGQLRRQLLPISDAAATPSDPADLFFVGTDGWISLPASPGIPTFHPDTYAPTNFTTYIFGFRNMTGIPPMDPADPTKMNPLVIGQKIKLSIAHRCSGLMNSPAPILSGWTC